MPRPHLSSGPDAAAVVTRAVLRAATRLGFSNRALAGVLGLSEATISRMGSGAYQLSPSDKAYDLAVLFIRMFRAVDAIVGGDEPAARAWMQAENTTLGGTPAALIKSVPGLVTVVGYLDARRSLG